MMRIAVPVAGGKICAGLAACAAIKFYEDDHGRITKRFNIPVEAGETALSAVERYGVDVLLCFAPAEEERQALAASGLLLAAATEQDADGAVRSYLNAAIACDPDNDCNYCGFKDECGLPRE